MLSSWTLLLWALTLTGLEANPGVVVDRRVEISNELQRRSGPTPLGNFNLTTEHENTQLLSVVVAPAITLKVDCVDCRTWGEISVVSDNSVKAKALPAKVHGSSLSAIGTPLVIDVSGVGGHFDFAVIAADTLSFSFPLFTSETPAGISLPNGDNVGLIFTLALVFTLSDSLNFTGGFEVDFPSDSTVTIDPLNGHILEVQLSGVVATALPVTISAGAATVGVALQANVQLGTTLEFFGTGVSFELGAFINLVNLKAIFDSDAGCGLSVIETLDIDIGASAKEVIEIDYHTFGITPKVATVIALTTLGSSCLVGAAATTTSAAATQTATLSTASWPIVTSVSTTAAATTTLAAPSTTSLASLTLSTPAASSSTISLSSLTLSTPAASYSTIPLSNFTLSTSAASYSAISLSSLTISTPAASYSAISFSSLTLSAPTASYSNISLPSLTLSTSAASYSAISLPSLTLSTPAASYSAISLSSLTLSAPTASYSNTSLPILTLSTPAASYSAISLPSLTLSTPAASSSTTSVSGFTLSAPAASYSAISLPSLTPSTPAASYSAISLPSLTPSAPSASYSAISLSSLTLSTPAASSISMLSVSNFPTIVAMPSEAAPSGASPSAVWPSGAAPSGVAPGGASSSGVSPSGVAPGGSNYNTTSNNYTTSHDYTTGPISTTPLGPSFTGAASAIAGSLYIVGAGAIAAVLFA